MTPTKTYKREGATGILLFWAFLLVWGLLDPTTGAKDAAMGLTTPVLLLWGSAFGLDAALKQNRSNT